MAVCRRNGRCIAHQAGFISDKDYYGQVVTPLPMDLTGNGAMLRADEDRKRFIENFRRYRVSEKWELDQRSEPIWSRGWHVRNKDGSTVAVVLSENKEAATFDDAKLIAAAPDMLAMLERVLKNLKTYQSVEYHFLIEEIEAVLKKARNCP